MSYQQPYQQPYPVARRAGGTMMVIGVILVLVGIVVGGLASVTGSILGAAFVQAVPHAAEHLSQEAAWAVYGVFLLLALWLAPGGIAALLRRLLGSISSGRN